MGALEKAGHKFKKKPDEGRMKGLAFAYDADRYWVEICSRSSAYQHKNSCNFSQVMLRIKSPAHSIPLYRDYFGMTLVRELHFPKNKDRHTTAAMRTIWASDTSAFWWMTCTSSATPCLLPGFLSTRNRTTAV